jgi:solute carrier family 25 oxoglutarate transporter 11
MAAKQADPPAVPVPSAKGAWNTVKPFVNGGASGMLATCIIQPIDMVKVRLQLGATGSPIAVASGIIKQDGVGALYRGLSAGLLRQATYTTARLGIYQVFTDALTKHNEGGAIPLYQKAGAGLAAGGMGALVGSPADLSLIRMQADSTLPIERRRNYKSVVDALVRIVKEDGAAGLFTGAGPTVVRAMALNMGMLASNDQIKELLREAGASERASVLGGATLAGFIASAFSLPFDFVKTRMQKMERGPDGKYPYAGPVDCALQTIKNEGPLKFYTGFPTYCVRIAPHVTLTLVFLDALKKAQGNMGM